MLEADLKVGQLFVREHDPRGQVYKKLDEGLAVRTDSNGDLPSPTIQITPVTAVLPHYTFQDRLAVVHRLLVALETGDGRDDDKEIAEEYESAIKAYCVMVNMIYCVVEHYPLTGWQGVHFYDKEEEIRVLESRAAHQWKLSCFHPNGNIKTTRRGSREALQPFIEICDEWNAVHARV